MLRINKQHFLLVITRVSRKGIRVICSKGIFVKKYFGLLHYGVINVHFFCRTVLKNVSISYLSN